VDLSKEALYPILEREYGVVFLRAEEFIEPVLADARVARYLHIPRGSPVFLVERTSYMADDRIGEFRRGHMRGTCTGTGSICASPDHSRVFRE